MDKASKEAKMGQTPWTLGGTKVFDKERYAFVANFSTKREADANARTQRHRGMKARIWKWKREDGKILYSVWIRRSKRFRW